MTPSNDRPAQRNRETDGVDDSSERAKEKRALQWQECEDCGPIAKLRRELKEQDERREKAMKRTILLATFVVTVVTGGIQVLGLVSAHASANAQLVKAMTDLQAAVKTATDRGK